jgi:peptidoglycan/xylan/chitin deacetylase (PgdA/CDA1 family)
MDHQPSHLSRRDFLKLSGAAMAGALLASCIPNSNPVEQLATPSPVAPLQPPSTYKKYFTLSFDDGLEQDKKIIQILKQYGIQSTFNLNAGLFGTKNRVARIGNIGFAEYPEGSKGFISKFPNADHYRIPEDEIVQVYDGFEIASHGYKHEALASIPEDQMEESIRKDVEALSTLAGYPIVGHAYPGGSSSDKVTAVLKKYGIIYGREVLTTGSFSFPDDPFKYRATSLVWDKKLFDLADQFIAAQAQTDDMLFYIWGHGYELDFGTELASWDRFEKFCEKIAGQDDIVYCTNKQAFEEHLQKKS